MKCQVVDVTRRIPWTNWTVAAVCAALIIIGLALLIVAGAPLAVIGLFVIALACPLAVVAAWSMQPIVEIRRHNDGA